ncbi:MAG TPA: toll/interleukin-1 receptor domain-containing protein [Solirubrobacterales bacterium]|nr:toll/interleukin-1 receptor domain-containing protein [Solirubrobacterales bacterium]
MKVFVSHSSTDKWVARQIAGQLEERGIETFLDEKDIETGASIGDSIQANLAECDELLMVLSPASLKSSWVLVEIGGAKALNKRLIPILLHVGPNELPDVLGDGLARDINEIERYYDEVELRSREPAGARPDPRLERHDERAARAPRTFPEGALVRLPREVPGSTYARDGTDIGWAPDMERYLGVVTEVISADEARGTVHVDADNGAWWWLMDWLDPVVAKLGLPEGTPPSRLGKGLH